jgi:tRNA pseudouridine32 synthase / 23S rRNA pseudouridine746 synthase
MMQDTFFPSIPRLEIIFEDDDIIAINKPAGLLSIQDGYQISLPNVRSILSERTAKIWTVHRLDKETSGLILFAKNSETHRSLSIQFEQRSIKKEYRGIVIGIPDWQQKTIELPLRVNGDRRHRTIVDLKNGKPAQTFVEVLHTHFTTSSIVIQPYTGYTHQIRAHLSYIGNPLVGDELYQNQIEKRVPLEKHYSVSRIMLHAFSMEFNHPANNRRMKLSAPFPLDFQL